MSLVERAIWVVERNLDQDLSLGTIAGACSVSTFHLSHAFTTNTGMPITDYLRRRRLTLAAERLADGWPQILELALISGYASHEAFSRAFKAQFGLAPEEVRRRASVADLPLLSPIDMTSDHDRTLTPPTLRQLGAMSFAALRGQFSWDHMELIPGQWRRFMAIRDLVEQMPGWRPVGIAGVVAADGGFSYASAVAIDTDTEVPREMTRIEITPRHYAVFRHQGHVSTIRGTYAKIWDRGLPDNGWAMDDAPSLEFHDPPFDGDTGEGGVAIWVPVAATSIEIEPRRLEAASAVGF